MNILAIDTSTEMMSVSLTVGVETYSHHVCAGFKHSERLHIIIDSLLKEGGINPLELNLVICSQGPGSFTGLRVGMAAAKGLCCGSGAAFITIPTLDLYGYDLSFFDGVVIPIIDAKKKRYFTAFFRNGERISEYQDISPTDLINNLQEFNCKILFTGPDASSFFSIMEKNVLFDKSYNYGRSMTLCKLGLKKFQTQGIGDVFDSSPLYVRKSDAEENRGIKNG